jgi:2,4-dienoyl-CoA reductase-like NADH-dependent reductase (Old Yellow Enzyme family)
VGIIWFEAIAIEEDGRANPRQLFLNSKTLDSFKKLIEMIKETSYKENGFEPLVIAQATHSGRYSRPHGVPEPIIAYNNPIFEKGSPVGSEHIVSDDHLKELERKFGETALLAKQSGFDGVDIKCCHRYLLNELLSAYIRKGLYGGSFENRTRLLVNAVKAAKANTSGRFIVTSRLNTYDGFAYPYGFGVRHDGSLDVEPSEALRLVGILHKELHMQLINISAGNPYVNPHVNRPYDSGGYLPDENPLMGVARIVGNAREVQQAYPDLRVICSGLSYLRQFAPNLAAGAVEQGYATFAGFGRLSISYPDFLQDLRQHGEIDGRKCCITCGKCTELMRASTVSGCVVRDSETYLPIYKNIK